MEAKPIALSVLMTREEYMQLTVQIHRLRRRPVLFHPGGRDIGDPLDSRSLFRALYCVVPLFGGLSAAFRRLPDVLRGDRRPHSR